MCALCVVMGMIFYLIDAAIKLVYPRSCCLESIILPDYANGPDLRTYTQQWGVKKPFFPMCYYD